jgi:hypothetical protein
MKLAVAAQANSEPASRDGAEQPVDGIQALEVAGRLAYF